MRLSTLLRESIARAVMGDVPDDTPSPTMMARMYQDALNKRINPAVMRFAKRFPTAIMRSKLDQAKMAPWEHRYVIGDLSKEAAETIVAQVAEPYLQAKENRRNAYNRLLSALKGCQTTKQVVAMFPEFEKYVPTDAQPTRNLPALTNVVADIVKLGWPKGQQQQQPRA